MACDDAASDRAAPGGAASDVPAEPVRDSCGDLLAELPGLYASLFSTAAYFAIYDAPRRLLVCELEEPRHVVVCSALGASAEVLNRGWDIDAPALARAARAIFRARPETRRIRAEVSFVPAELEQAAGSPAAPLFVRELYREDDLVLELPASAEEWRGSLGASTRRHLREYGNQLRRRHPDFALSALEGEAIDPAVVNQVFTWNAQRVRAKGGHWFYDGEPAAAHRLWRLVGQGGVALRGECDGELAAVDLFAVVGHEGWGLMSGIDAACADVHLGLLMMAFTVAEAIGRGCTRLHMSWGNAEYKRHLGARPVAIHRVSIFRSPTDRALYAGERLALRVWDRRDIRYLSARAGGGCAAARRPGEPRTAIDRFARELVRPQGRSRGAALGSAARWCAALWTPRGGRG